MVRNNTTGGVLMRKSNLLSIFILILAGMLSVPCFLTETIAQDRTYFSIYATIIARFARIIHLFFPFEAGNLRNFLVFAALIPRQSFHTLSAANRFKAPIAAHLVDNSSFAVCKRSHADGLRDRLIVRTDHIRRSLCNAVKLPVLLK